MNVHKSVVEVVNFICAGFETPDVVCYDLAVVIVQLGLLGDLLTLKDVHNVENQWLKQVSNLKRA